VERDDVEADSKAKDGMTPLSYAEFGGYEVVVKLPNWHYPYHEAVIGIDLCAIARSPCDTTLGRNDYPLYEVASTFYNSSSMPDWKFHRHF